MQISIESYLEKLMLWEFTVKYQGQVYTVRPLTIGDMMLIEAIIRQQQRIHQSANDGPAR